MEPAEYSIYIFLTCTAIFVIPGPIFFLSINEGMRDLRRGGMMMFGVLTAQTILLILLDIGFIFFLQRILTILRIIGIILLIVLGSSAIRRGIRGTTATTQERIGAPYTRGFLLTFLNPPFIVWFITVGSTLLETGIKELGSFAFILFSFVLLASSIIVMAAIILSVHSGKRLIGMREIRALSIISGVGFIIIAAVFVLPILIT
ncbi:LysE family transporter [[Eubacterium] cellulosolvens]